jgi:membrane dipeptidase
MNRREFAAAGAAALAASFAPPVLADAPANKPRKWAPYANAIAVDGCGGFGRYPGREDGSFDALDLGDARETGLSAVVLTLAPRGFPRFTNEAFEHIQQEVTYWDNQLKAHPDTFTLITSGADFARAKRERKAGVIYGFQDSSPIGEDLDRIDMFRKRGLRVIQLTHNQRNLVGDGCMEPGNAGLSEYGRQFIERLNAQRVVVDVAHGGRRTTSEGIAASKAPVIISHTGCAALSDLPRCVTDEALRAMADRGGVAGIVFWPYLRRQGQQTAEDIIRHVEHAIKICGEDHVGLGSDATVSAVDITPEYAKENREMIERMIKDGIFEPRSPDLYLLPPDLNHTRRFETLGAMLSERGHSDTRIAKILGGNFARVMGEVWG